MHPSLEGAFLLRSKSDALPDARMAREDGLVAAGGKMSVERLTEAYSKGIFPWTAKPVTWWSPDPRAIFPLGAIHIPRRLAKAVRNHPYRVSFDEAFGQVIRACALAPRWGDNTWITEDFENAYREFHRAGFAHSIELWRATDGGEMLAAGLYGVAIGGFFAGESMFHREPDASKIALVLLQQHLAAAGFTLFDTQMLTPVTELMGAQLISRHDYLQRLDLATALEDVRFPRSKSDPSRGSA
jgi:leucyl/phenylalanyl-tRNA--protein transferase